MRERYIADPLSGRLVPEAEYYANRPRPARGAFPAPRIQSDAMEPVVSMLDGKKYDSKSALRSTYRRAGVVEVGNDSSIVDPKPFKRASKDKDIRAAVDRAFSRAGFGA